MTKRIAILGATGHIAKGLIERLGPDYIVTRYSRNEHRPYLLLMRDEHDVIINCIGVGEKLWTTPFRIFEITEQYDNMVIDYLDAHPETLDINFSSGAVYGDIYDAPAIDGSTAMFDPAAPNFYGIAKLNSEAKHRALDKLNIVDLRVFSYFSEHMRSDDLSIMNEILTCIREDRELVVSPRDFYRDYIHPDDLARLVKCCIEMHNLNAAFDAYSLRPVSKSMLLAFFAQHYGLKNRVDDNFRETSPTGTKPYYYSDNIKAEEIGYHPQYSALEAIRDGAEKIVSRKDAKAQRKAEKILS